MNQEANKILFVHVPKTAGITLYRSLQKAIGKSIRFNEGNKANQDEYLAMSDEELRSFNLISGHFPLPFFLRKPISDYKVITVVRDPVDRELSTFFYIKTWDKHPKHKMLQGMDLYAYLDSREKKDKNMNPQCQYISGSGRFTEAKKIIDTAFFLAAPVEYLQEFCDELAKRLGMEAISLKRHNVTKFRLSVGEIHPDIKKRFERLLTDDIALYEYVKRKFEKEVMGLQ